MDSLGGNILPLGLNNKLLFAGLATALCAVIGLSRLSKLAKKTDGSPNLVKSLLLFCYSCFIKPHQGDTKGNQQDALESFYGSQADVYDVTRKTLLKGREDMLALVAAQLADKDAVKKGRPHRRVWVDVRLSPRQRYYPFPALKFISLGWWRHRLEH